MVFEEIKVERFNGQNYALWKMQMEDFLYQKDLWRPLQGKAKKPTAMSDEDWDILDRKALGAIQLCLSPSVAFNISKAKTTAELMTILDKLYEKPSASNKVFLIKRLVNMKMVEGKSMAEHLNNFNTITSQLASVKITFDEEVRSLLILSSLPESWNSVVMAVSNSVSGSNTLKFDDVVGVILSEEMRRKSEDETPTGNAFIVDDRDDRGRSRERGRNTNDHDRSQARSKSRSRETGCWFCGKPGHIKKNCWTYKKVLEKEKEEEANVDCQDDTGILILTTEETADHVWVLDSGASFHVTPHKEYFESLQIGNFGKVVLGNNESCDVSGMGDVLLKLKNGNSWLL